MKKLLPICAVIIFLLGCNNKENSPDAEMFNTANKVYQDYLFEYGIDSKIFSLPIIETQLDGTKSFKWIAIDSKKNVVSVEVLVVKTNDTKPELILTGNNDAWLHLMNTKERKKGRHYF